VTSFLRGVLNPDLSGVFRGLSGRPNRHPAAAIPSSSHTQRIETRDYSAAAANSGFIFADDVMKSEIRGTISDLKRDPLKTP
jgi:hypothetical protein